MSDASSPLRAALEAVIADLPLIDLPEAIDPGGNGLPLLDSRWPFTHQCRRLIDSKSYRG